MIARNRQSREIEEMLIQEFSSLYNMGDFTSESLPDEGRAIVQRETREKKSNVVYGRYIPSRSQLYHPEAKGICSNCLNFKNCRLSKNPAGVWHCEEYL
jgi:hypothetical protein